MGIKFNNREHDFNNDSRLDGLEILAAIKHSDLATDLNLETKNLSGADLKEAYHKEINYYAGKDNFSLCLICFFFIKF